MSISCLKRLQKEMQELKKSPPPLITAEPENVQNLFKWKATITGPPDSPFKGGLFQLKLEVTAEYPFVPPAVTFETKIYHPNVNTQGQICLDILRPSDWTPSMNIASTLVSIAALMSEPNHGHAFDPTYEPAKFKELSVLWTQVYANPKGAKTK